MHVYMTNFVYDKQMKNLNDRIVKLEAENLRLNMALQDIAFERINNE